uniref:Uncharacterized protein ycf68 n=1 Tax=Chenopodium album TaxID=3559 RepID=A0A291S830_CHEAL|nr:hypothetical protein [Chenopodium album]
MKPNFSSGGMGRFRDPMEIQLSIHSWDPGGPGGTTTAPLFSRIHTSLISVWTAISRAQGVWTQWKWSI